MRKYILKLGMIPLLVLSCSDRGPMSPEVQKADTPTSQARQFLTKPAAGTDIALTNTGVTDAQVNALINGGAVVCDIVSGFLRDDEHGSNDCIGDLQSVAFDLGGGLHLYGYQLECHCGPNWDVGYVNAGGPISVPLGAGCEPLAADFDNDGNATETSFHTTGTAAFVGDLAVFNFHDVFGKSAADFTTSATYTGPGPGSDVHIFNADGIFFTGDVAGFVTNSAPITVTGANLGGSFTVFDMCAPGDCNLPPDCSDAAASIEEIWPPNHKMVGITITGVTDPDGDAVTITIDGITQDEPLDTFGDGSFEPDGDGVGTSTALVRAERSGTKKVPGNGRVYEISYTADDGKGGTCSGTVTVCVPHDQRKGHVCIDDGQTVDSTGP